jgi:hypothetical protein
MTVVVYESRLTTGSGWSWEFRKREIPCEIGESIEQDGAWKIALVEVQP